VISTISAEWSAASRSWTRPAVGSSCYLDAHDLALAMSGGDLSEDRLADLMAEAYRKLTG
jgi:hypothetical protein